MRGRFEISYEHETIRYYFLNPLHCLTNFVRSNINIYSIKEKRCSLSTMKMAAGEVADILAYNSIDGLQGAWVFLAKDNEPVGQ